MSGINMQTVVSVDIMSGEDANETELLRQMYVEAKSYISRFKWCFGISESFFGLGLGGIVAVFLFRINAEPSVDEWLWVIVGDLPSAYMVSDKSPDPVSALNVYCELMNGWVEAVRAGVSVSNAFPVDATPTPEKANLLARRIELLRHEIIPAFEQG